MYFNLKNKYGIDAKVLLEPVFDIEKEIYYELIEQATFYENEPYIIAYILDPNDEKLAVINKIGYLIRQDRINRKLSLKTQSKLSNIFISTFSSIENDRNVNRVFFV